MIGLPREDEQIRQALEWLVHSKKLTGCCGYQPQNAGEGVGPDAGDATLDQPSDLPDTQAVLMRTSCGAGLTPLKIRLLVLIPLPAHSSVSDLHPIPFQL